MSQKNIIPFDELPDAAFIRQAQLIPSIIPISPATLWRKVKNGSLPSPYRLSCRTVAWRVGDIRKFLENPNQEFA